MTAPRVHIVVQNAADPDEPGAGAVPPAAALRRWARAALNHRGRGGELTLRIVGRDEGTALNERYRGRRGPTNVLSFPCGPEEAPQTPLLGDIVICAPVVAAEAAAQGKAPEAHWAHLVVHGVLHLLGYDHETARQAREMEGLETAILNAWGYPDPYAELPAAGPA